MPHHRKSGLATKRVNNEEDDEEKEKDEWNFVKPSPMVHVAQTIGACSEGQMCTLCHVKHECVTHN